MCNGRPYVLVRWTGYTWEPLNNLTNCKDAIGAFEQATGRSLPRPALPPPAGTAVAPPPIPPTGFTVEAAPAGDLGAARRPRSCASGHDCAVPVARRWQAVRHSRSPLPTTAYDRQTSALRSMAGTLLDAASYGSRWVLSRRPRPRVRPGPFAPGPPDPKFKFGRWLVTAKLYWSKNMQRKICRNMQVYIQSMQKSIYSLFFTPSPHFAGDWLDKIGDYHKPGLPVVC